jgi:hypothetical protein
MNITGMDLERYPAGNYTGKMVLYSSNMTTVIPVIVEIIADDDKPSFKPFPEIAYLVVGVGVMTGFASTYLRKMLTEEKAALKATKDAIASYDKARMEKRGAAEYFHEGYDNFRRAAQYLYYRKYARAEELFKISKNYWDTMKGDYPVPKKDLEKEVLEIREDSKKQESEKEVESENSRTDSKKKKKDRLLFESSTIQILLLAGMLSIAIVATWQGILPDVANFDDPFKDALAAFMFGFGSQALLQHVVPLIAGKTEEST